ncbi:Ribosomal large subunit pseudouridine synthase F [Clostridiaceae bacterium JG1575]|nr:Ribosomal large subunit pseudouridine synthase F [Clostridiaceae bacterium JG1575]
MNQPKLRINKYLSESGVCSRREADRLIEEGVVEINHEKATLGSKVSPGDVVTLRGTVVTPKKDHVYLAFHKPRGLETTTDERVADNVISYISFPQRIFPIGRLDKDSQGLLLFTDDGDIVNKILRSVNNHEKEYLVTVNRTVTDEFIQGMAQGVPILDTVTKPCTVEKLSTRQFRIILTQGLNRQIRRMTEHFGYRVTTLRRVRIMNIQLGSLPEGAIRPLSPLEMKTLMDSLEESQKHFL